jgi:hypothetical protein
MACHQNTQFEQAEKLTKCFKKINEFVRDTVKKLNLGLANVNDITSGLGYKNVCV